MKNLFILGGTVFLLSCGDPAATINTIKNVQLPVVLTESDIFKGNIVEAFLNNEKKATQDANLLFLNGINAYRNNNDLDSGAIYFKESILKEPSAKAYYEYGNLSMDNKDYEVALQSFGLAEQLGYQPFSKILYNKSCVYSLQKELQLSAQYLEYALKAGYSNLDHLKKDEDLSNLRENYLFDQAFKNGIKGMSDADNIFWLQFKNSFPKIELPLKLKSYLSYEETEPLGFISYDYEKYISEMRNASFSRDAGSEYYYFAQPYENENFVALVYIVREAYMGDASPLEYILVTFTHEGKIIDKRVISGSENLNEAMLVATLNEDMRFIVDVEEKVYEKDPVIHGFLDNKVVEVNLLGTDYYRISNVGKIIEVVTEADEVDVIPSDSIRI